jgi:hypothetical protein
MHVVHGQRETRASPHRRPQVLGRPQIIVAHERGRPRPTAKLRGRPAARLSRYHPLGDAGSWVNGRARVSPGRRPWLGCIAKLLTGDTLTCRCGFAAWWLRVWASAGAADTMPSRRAIGRTVFGLRNISVSPFNREGRGAHPVWCVSAAAYLGALPLQLQYIPLYIRID